MAQHVVGIGHLVVGKDVGMAADELFHGLGDGIHQAEITVFHGDLGVEDDLEQQIAQLAAQVVHIVGVEGRQHLVGLFEEAGAQGFVGLLAVPGAAVGRPQAGHHVLESATEPGRDRGGR